MAWTYLILALFCTGNGDDEMTWLDGHLSLVSPYLADRNVAVKILSLFVFTGLL